MTACIVLPNSTLMIGCSSPHGIFTSVERQPSCRRNSWGPSKISAKIGGQAYTLQLPDDWKIHPTFHVSLLKPWRQDTWREEAEELHSGVGARR